MIVKILFSWNIPCAGPPPPPLIFPYYQTNRNNIRIWSKHILFYFWWIPIKNKLMDWLKIVSICFLSFQIWATFSCLWEIIFMADWMVIKLPVVPGINYFHSYDFKISAYIGNGKLCRVWISIKWMNTCRILNKKCQEAHDFNTHTHTKMI